MENNQEYMYDFTEDVISAEEAGQLHELHKNVVKSYSENSGNVTAEQWLSSELQKHLPEKTNEEIAAMSRDIAESIRVTEKKKSEQQIAIREGKSDWLASELEKATSHMTVQNRTAYLNILDAQIRIANEDMRKAITTRGSHYSLPNRNPNLDGFIAEQHHVNTYNLDAAAKGSGLRAEVPPLRPGETYSKNGFDIVIKDANGKIVHQYQVKYGATAEDTIRLLKDGNYNNQTIVVPEKQVEAVQKAFPGKTVRSTIGDEKVQSKPLTKEEAKKLQKEAQKGNFDFLNSDWNDLSTKVITKGMAKQVAYATAQSAAIGAGISLAAKAIRGEEIEGEEVVRTAISTGVDTGVKTATAGALKIAAEKGIVKSLKGATGTMCANIAFVAVENVKVFGKVASGEMTAREGMLAMEQTTGACVAGMTVSAKGAVIGGSIGSVLGPVGVAVGGFIGGSLGYIAGSKVGQAVIKGVQKAREVAVKTVKTVVKKVAEGVKSVVKFVAGLFGF